MFICRFWAATLIVNVDLTVFIPPLCERSGVRFIERERSDYKKKKKKRKKKGSLTVLLIFVSTSLEPIMIIAVKDVGCTERNLVREIIRFSASIAGLAGREATLTVLSR